MSAGEELYELAVVTVAGELYVGAAALADAFRARAAAYRDQAAANVAGDAPSDDQLIAANADLAIAAELDARADALDLAGMAHATDAPGDSPICQDPRHAALRGLP